VLRVAYAGFWKQRSQTCASRLTSKTRERDNASRGHYAGRDLSEIERSDQHTFTGCRPK
jgi:hypothetical protein